MLRTKNEVEDYAMKKFIEIHGAYFEKKGVIRVLRFLFNEEKVDKELITLCLKEIGKNNSEYEIEKLARKISEKFFEEI